MITPGIHIPILLIFLFPVLLWLLARPPLQIIQPALRFKLASIIILCSWCFAKVVWPISYGYWIAGFLFMFSYLIFIFMIWSVLCWGYTVGMLLSLNEIDVQIESHEWQKLHTGHYGTGQLTADRAQLLVKLHLATIADEELVMTSVGIFVAKTTRYIANLFGVKI